MGDIRTTFNDLESRVTVFVGDRGPQGPPGPAGPCDPAADETITGDWAFESATAPTAASLTLSQIDDFSGDPIPGTELIFTANTPGSAGNRLRMLASVDFHASPNSQPLEVFTAESQFGGVDGTIVASPDTGVFIGLPTDAGGAVIPPTTAEVMAAVNGAGTPVTISLGAGDDGTALVGIAFGGDTPPQIAARLHGGLDPRAVNFAGGRLVFHDPAGNDYDITPDNGKIPYTAVWASAGVAFNPGIGDGPDVPFVLNPWRGQPDPWNVSASTHVTSADGLPHVMAPGACAQPIIFLPIVSRGTIQFQYGQMYVTNADASQVLLLEYDGDPVTITRDIGRRATLPDLTGWRVVGNTGSDLAVNTEFNGIGTTGGGVYFACFTASLLVSDDLDY